MKKIGIVIATCAAIAVTVLAVGACGSSGTLETTQDQSEALEQYLATAETGGKDDKVPDATSEEVEIVAIYTPEADGSFKLNMDSVDILTEYDIVTKLKDYKVLPEGTSIDSFDMTPIESEAAVGPGAQGESAVELSNATLNLTGIDTLDNDTAQAVANTFIDAFNLNQITISIDGKAVVTDVEFKK